MPGLPALRPLHRNLIGAALALVLLGVASFLLAEPVTGMTAGAWLAEIRGHTDTQRHDKLQDASGVPVPSWLPGATSGVTIKRPGPASGMQNDGNIKIDGTVPAGWQRPATCTAAEYGMPFDGGGYWPLTTRSTLFSCPDGTQSWRLMERGAHVYVWR